MSKPLWGGSAAAVALLSASLLFYAQPSVAEPLAVTSQDKQPKDAAQEIKTPETDASAVDAAAAGVVGARLAEETNKVENAEPKTSEGQSRLADEVDAEGPARQFTATAYSLRGRTASGRPVGRGLIAADRRVLPIGTRVRIEAGPYSGEYLVADTGGAVRGRKIDIWMPSTREAMRFGRRPVKLTVLTRTRPRTNARPVAAVSKTE